MVQFEEMAITSIDVQKTNKVNAQIRAMPLNSESTGKPDQQLTDGPLDNSSRLPLELFGPIFASLICIAKAML